MSSTPEPSPHQRLECYVRFGLADASARWSLLEGACLGLLGIACLLAVATAPAATGSPPDAGHAGGRGVVLNVNDAAAAVGLIDAIQKTQGGLSILVNNAGITQDQLAMRMKEEEWDAVIATHP